MISKIDFDEKNLQFLYHDEQSDEAYNDVLFVTKKKKYPLRISLKI